MSSTVTLPSSHCHFLNCVRLECTPLLRGATELVLTGQQLAPRILSDLGKNRLQQKPHRLSEHLTPNHAFILLSRLTGLIDSGKLRLGKAKMEELWQRQSSPLFSLHGPSLQEWSIPPGTLWLGEDKHPTKSDLAWNRRRWLPW